ncbi:MAG: phospholipase D-like domain-containing protein, partial [Pseudomonadota bacterium]
WATMHMIQRLTDYGVSVYLQPPPFTHGKLLLIDDYYSIVGSANLDYRSLRLNFEIGLEIYSKELSHRLWEHIEKRRAISEALDPSKLETRSWIIRLRDATAWLAAPYL